MACYDCDEGMETDTVHFVMTVVMTGFVAIAIWELWGRHLAPFIYGHELSAADIIKALLGINDKLVAEAVYFVTAIPLVSLMYMFVWRPLIKATVIAENWVLSGGLYGLSLFVLAASLKSFVMTTPSHATLFSSSSSGWLIGALFTGIATAGFIHLREMGRQII